MYEKCLKCEHLGKNCLPNLCIMPVDEMYDFARHLKDNKHMSNADLSRISGVPKGTIDNSFSYNTDIRYTTFAPVFCALIGSDGEETPCPKFIADTKKDKETIERLEKENDNLKERLKEGKEKSQEDKKTITKQNRTIAFFRVIFVVFLLFVIAVLPIDKFNSDIGFFWIEKTASFFGNDAISFSRLTGWSRI